MAREKTDLEGLGRRVAHIGTRQIELEKNIKAEIAALRKEMGQMFQHFEGGKLREEVRHEPRAVSQDREIPYAPIFEERWRQTHRRWREAVISHLENLVYVGEDEDGVPMLADFEVQLRLPIVYLLMARRSGNRVKWISNHPYDDWKEEILKEKR